MRQVAPIAIVTDAITRAPTSTYLLARCSIAKGLRTFRYDRIVSLNEPRTGEEIGKDQWFLDQDLGPGAPFDWSETEPTAAQPIEQTAAVPRRIWRSLLAVLLVGYLVGRLRLLHLILRYFASRHGLWL